jgi:hypothetical protein
MKMSATLFAISIHPVPKDKASLLHGNDTRGQQR